jgi:hypothetical protein
MDADAEPAVTAGFEAVHAEPPREPAHRSSMRTAKRAPSGCCRSGLGGEDAAIVAQSIAHHWSEHRPTDHLNTLKRSFS